MKTIGLIGGVTPQSTIMYYQVLNRLANETYGGKHTAKVLINSLDFGAVSQYQSEGRWDLLDEMMVDAALNLERAGASSIVICANTMHLTVEAVEKHVSIPIVHIAEATAEAIQSKELAKVALLGTKYTMEKTFYKDVLMRYKIDSIIPEEGDREVIHGVIYNELAKGELKEESKNEYLRIIKKLEKQGAEGIILGCTEIPLLIQQKDVNIPVFDTTTIHASKAFSLSK
ncbi:L-aspartate/glutamate-specific racemase [Tenacibaculum sp. 190130A14a]|uniref:L-aspartate/glutamate-specific racemase n=1 Tax=Tenacibaculum polynesiense TaxID=3137857 RepID=A0ABP1F3Y1_9FLAO